jgi:hypothetical protein
MCSVVAAVLLNGTWLFANIPAVPMLAFSNSLSFPFLFSFHQNDLTFLRIRSKKHEIMVAPDKDFLLVVIQDPTISNKK